MKSGGGWGGGGCCPLQARYKKWGRGGGGCCPLQARYKKRGRGGCCLAEKGAVPYMKGGVATPKPPPLPFLDPPLENPSIHYTMTVLKFPG